jgi:ribonuclease HI
MVVEVYCDGSGQTMECPGGWGTVVVVDGVEKLRLSGSISNATNNIAEITAAIMGLEAVAGDSTLSASRPTLVSDSQLVLGYASGKYQCKAYHLVPLYIRLKKVYRQLEASTRWVKGHSGDHYNEICDKLAKAAREEIKNG